MDKGRVLALARQRRVKKTDGAPSEGDNTHVVEDPSGKLKGTAEAQPSALPPKPISKKRIHKQGDQAGSKKQKGGSPGLHLEDEDSESEVRELASFPVKSPREALPNLPEVTGGPAVASGSGGILPTGGVEGDIVLRLGPGQGWLGNNPEKFPLGALSFLSLPSDKALIETLGDEEALRSAKEAFGKFGTWFMEVADRVMVNRHRAATECNKAQLEKAAKTDAWKELKDVKGSLDAATQALKREKEAHAATVLKMSKAQDELSVEKGISASLEGEVEMLKKAVAQKEAELVKATETLEEVERNADILYEDCVKRYKESAEFTEEIELKAGVFHEEGWKDCLEFIGKGNPVDPEVHTIDRFQEVEAVKYEQAKAKAAEEKREAEAAKTGATVADGSVPVAAEVDVPPEQVGTSNP